MSSSIDRPGSMMMPAARAMPLALVITIALAMLFWGVSAQYITASVIEGVVIAAPYGRELMKTHRALRQLASGPHERQVERRDLAEMQVG